MPSGMRFVSVNRAGGFASCVLAIFNAIAFMAVAVLLPKLCAECPGNITRSLALLGFIAAGVDVFGAAARFAVGRLNARSARHEVTPWNHAMK